MKRDLERCSDIYKSEAKQAGLEYLGGSERANSYRSYRIVECQHEVDLLPANVRNNNYRCKTCLEDKFIRESISEGLVLLARITRHKSLYKLPCGHRQEIFLSAVRSSEWMCRKCNRSYFDLPSNLYLLKIKTEDFEWLKLGYSRNIKGRIRSYKLPPAEISYVFWCKVPSGSKAIQIEQNIHSEFFPYRLDPKQMQKYHTQDGYTECYPLEMEKDLVEALTRRTTAV